MLSARLSAAKPVSEDTETAFFPWPKLWRAHLSYEAKMRAKKVGTFDVELAEEFWTAFARAAKLALHIKQLDGRNAHHIIEGQFKSAARSLRTAVSIDPELAGEIPSTKGLL